MARSKNKGKKKKSRKRKPTKKKQKPSEKNPVAERTPLADSPNANQATQESNPSDKRAYPQYYFVPGVTRFTWPRFSWRAWRKFFAVVELFFAGAVAYYAMIQAGVMEDTLDQNSRFLDEATKTRKATESQANVEIARSLGRIAVTECSIERLVDGQPVKITFTISNTGEREVFVGKINAAAVYFSGNRPQVTSELNKIRRNKKTTYERHYGLLVSGKSITVPIAQAKKIHQGTIDRITDKETSLYLLGCVTFRDTNGRHHTDEEFVIFRYDPDSGMMVAEELPAHIDSDNSKSRSKK